jgi:hypothetical protein
MEFVGCAFLFLTCFIQMMEELIVYVKRKTTQINRNHNHTLQAEHEPQSENLALFNAETESGE